MYSGYPNTCQTLTDKNAYVDGINKGMGWEDDSKLSPDQIEDNAAQRNFYKLLMNALLGILNEGKLYFVFLYFLN
jgi:hypothetical protein